MRSMHSFYRSTEILFPLFSFQVLTEDGYILNIQRITKGNLFLILYFLVFSQILLFLF